MIERLRMHGVRFLAISQHIDTDESNPTSRLMLHILAAVAEFERELFRERVASGVANARRKGKRLARPKRVAAEEHWNSDGRASASRRSPRSLPWGWGQSLDSFELRGEPGLSKIIPFKRHAESWKQRNRFLVRTFPENVDSGMSHRRFWWPGRQLIIG